MKKRLLTLSLVSLMSAAMITSCSSDPYTWKEGVLLSIDGKEYKVSDIYADYDSNIDGARAYYEAINNVLVWINQDMTSTMEDSVDAKMDDFEQSVSDNASNNGTSEKEEREALLASLGFETMDELRNSYILEVKKTENNDDFYSDEAYTKDGGLIENLIENYYPYHVRHVLVNIDASGDAIVDGLISEDDSKQLSSVVERLSSGEETFGQVAQTSSDDSSASSFGDVGIMTTKTGFVSEFKYSLYAYDAYFNNSLTAEQKAAAKAALAIPNEADGVVGSHLYGIPSYAFDKLSEYADVTKSQDKATVEYASEVNYPRNIVFNKYLNNHGTSLIYYANEDGSAIIESEVPSRYKKFENTTLFVNSNGGDGMGTTERITVEGTKYVLCDETGNPILVTRAGDGNGESGYQGIHFIIAQRNPFVDSAKLKDYYTLDIPSTTANLEDDADPTYINFINTTDRSVYTNRQSAIKTAATDAYANINFEIFRANLDAAKANHNIKINGDIMNLVNKYIASVEETSDSNTAENYEKSWTTYLDKLNLHQSLKGRILPEGCISQFEDGEINRNGVCYVK